MTTQTPESQRSSRATLADIAVEAAVSMSTVSKVLNGKTGVSDATRARVEKLLQSYGYNRRGTSQSSTLVEIVFSQLNSAWAIEIIRGVESVAQEYGMSAVVTQSGDRRSPGPEWIDGVIKRNPVGVILVFSGLSAANKAQLKTRNIRFVIIDPTGNPAPDVPSIGSANWTGGVLAARHLVGLGHKRIAVITGPGEMMSSRARLSGFQSAMELAGIEVPDEYIVPGNYHREDGVSGGLKLLELPERPTAIFAGNDLQALGIYEAARTLGLSIPQDLSVVGYDDLELAKWVGPPLTTVRQPLTEMAEQATRLVLGVSGENENDTVRIDLATDLVVRDSTARYPSQ
ncbi:MAG: LacI family DNA-binding transcriptional regulator [Lacisediminihabitans sp.]